MALKPFFRKFDGWWYAQIQLGEKRRQIKLVKGKENQKEAYRIFCRVMAEEGTYVAKDNSQPVAVICDFFLENSHKKHSARTFAWHKQFLQDFCARYGSILVSDLKTFHVQRWLDSHPTWEGARRHAIGILKRSLNWAEEQGYISHNPIRKMKKPPVGRRTRVLDENEQKLILDSIPDESFRQFVFALQETGCRPSEISNFTAENVHLVQGIWVIEQHKTVQKTNRPRIIYYVDTAAIVQRGAE